MDKKIRVAITHGDTNGIGYEIILKAFEDSGMLEMCTPIIYGNPKIATYHRNALQLETPFSIISKAEDAHPDKLNMLATFDEEVKVEFGSPTPESAEAARKALQRAKEDLKNGLYDVLVQAPVVPNRTPDANDKSLLIMFADDIRIALATNHLPLKDVAANITADKLVEKCRLLHTSLKRDFRINNPRIAVLALNPQPGSIPNQALRKRISSPLPSRPLRSQAFRSTDPLPLMISSATACTMVSTPSWRCTTIRAMCLSRRWPPSLE